MSTRFWRNVAGFTLLCLILFCIWVFYDAEAAPPAYKTVNQRAGTFTDSMSTVWHDLSAQLYPESFRWWVSVDNCSDTTARMTIEVQTSCDTLADPIRLGIFTDGFTNPYDTLIGGTTIVGSSYLFWAPRPPSQALTSDSTYIVAPILPPCRYIRLFFDADDAVTNWTTDNILLIE